MPTNLQPAQPRDAAEQRPWSDGLRGMGAMITPEALRERIAEAEANRQIAWLFDPHPKQLEILQARERFLAAACGRRFGKTMIALRWLTEEVTRLQGLTWWIAPTYATSMRAWADVIRLLPRKFRTVLKGERRIELAAGGAIEFKSADNPDALRGAGLVAAVLDEAAYIDDYVYQDVISPMLLTTQGRVLAISSPRAKKGWFYQLFRAGQQGTADHRSWQLPTSANPYVPAAEIARLQQTLPESTFRREILAQFLDELASVFPGVREIATAARPVRPVAAEYVMGIDWGRRHDFTVAATLRILGDGQAEMVELLRFTDLPYAEQLARIREQAAIWQPRAILAEQNSMGGPLVEQLQADGLPLTGFQTTAQSKAPLIQQLQLAIQNRGLRLLNEPALLNEFEDYEEEILPSGGHTFNAPPRQHDDTIIATALAWRLVAGEPGGQRVEGFRGSPDSFLLHETYAPALLAERYRDAA